MSHATTPVSKPVLGPIPPIPNSQALSSKTFRVPPLDGSLLLPEIWDWHFEYSPNHPVFAYTEDDGTEKVLHWREVVPGIHRAGALMRSLLTRSSESRPIVAILSASGMYGAEHAYPFS